MLPFYIIVLVAIGLPVILLIVLAFFCEGDGDEGPYTTYGPDIASIFDEDGPFRR